VSRSRSWDAGAISSPSPTNPGTPAGSTESSLDSRARDTSMSSSTLSSVASVAAFREMLQRDRERWGIRECQAAWRFGVSVREYRKTCPAMEASRWPSR
jgi:hypothetical protein